MARKNSKKSRPQIPTELRRSVLLEAGHRCAIATCRQSEIDIHHIEPWEECLKHEFHNLIALCPNCHRRVHKGEIDRKSLKAYKNKLQHVVDHGVVKNEKVVLSREDGYLHRLTVEGYIEISTTGWSSPVDRLILKMINGGKYAIKWNGFKTLPFGRGVEFSRNGTDIIEMSYYDGDVYCSLVQSDEF